MNSRQKGASGEREPANKLKEYGFPDMELTAAGVRICRKILECYVSCCQSGEKNWQYDTGKHPDEQ